MRFSYLKSRLDGLEANLQQIVEGFAVRWLEPDDLLDDLAHQLVEALHSGLKVLTGDQIAAPNLFIIRANPAIAKKLLAQPLIIESISAALNSALMENGARLSGPLSIRVVEAEDAPLRIVQVEAHINPESISQTSDLTPEDGLAAAALPVKAFLIVDGTRIFSLDRTVINIGRRPDNQLIIDDARVSRLHAQLRAIRGRYVIFDLNSTGGTYVNEHRIHQCALHPGDVISLAGVPIVFGQDIDSTGETQRLEPSS
jgi:hypothetical protein